MNLGTMKSEDGEEVEFTTNNISVGSTLQLDGNNFTISGIVSNA